MGRRIFKRLRDLIDVDPTNIGDGLSPVYRSASGKHEYETVGGSPTGAAGGVLGGTYPNPSFAADMATQAELDAHTGDTSDAHDASAISADSTTLVGTGTDVQAVLEELDNAIAADTTALADHIADTADAHDASAISIVDAGGAFTATDVEGALDELVADIAGISADSITSTSSPAADVTASGVKSTGTAGETLAFGDPVYVKSDGKLWKADANGSATFPAIGIAISSAAADASVTILTHGWARNDAWAWTVGGIVYLSTSAGLTQTQPSATNDVIQPIGFATHADRMHVNPSLFYVTHV